MTVSETAGSSPTDTQTAAPAPPPAPPADSPRTEHQPDRRPTDAPTTEQPDGRTEHRTGASPAITPPESAGHWTHRTLRILAPGALFLAIRGVGILIFW